MFPPVVLTGSIRDDPYWTSRETSLELIELSSINKVSLVYRFPPVVYNRVY